MTPDYMVFDVESVGLHGEGFAVGWVVIDRMGREHSSGRLACDPNEAEGDDDDRRWVQENVPVPKGGWNSHCPGCVRQEFWQTWDAARQHGVILVADCPWPVEARFLAQCVDDDLNNEHSSEGRASKGPYPLLDVASIRLAAGLDPLGTNERKPDELPIHDPLADARQSARLLIEALNILEATAT